MEVENRELLKVITRLKAVSHDTRNLVSVLDGNLRLTTKHLENNNKTRAMEFLLKSQQITTRMASTVSAQREPAEKICVNTILTEVASNYDIKNLMIRHDFQHGNTYIKGRYTEIYRAFQNIIKNGIEAMDANIQTKELHFSSSKTGDNVKVGIFNNGPHIPTRKVDGKNSVRHIFERGFTSGEGEGIGLASTKDLVNEHGGVIGVSNVKDGGVRFSLSFPTFTEESN